MDKIVFWIHLMTLQLIKSCKEAINTKVLSTVQWGIPEDIAKDVDSIKGASHYIQVSIASSANRCVLWLMGSLQSLKIISESFDVSASVSDRVLLEN